MAHRPVRVITVEREYGSHGAEFAHDLAARLGWRLLDSELVTGAARMAGVDPKTAAKFDERLDPWYYRVRQTLLARSAVRAGDQRRRERPSTPSACWSSSGRRFWKPRNRATACWWAADRPARLPGRPGCFHVFVYATASAKKEWFARAFPAAGAACGAASGGLRPAARGGDPQVLPAGVVLARALSHAAQLVHWHGGDDYRGRVCGGIMREAGRRDGAIVPGRRRALYDSYDGQKQA